MLNVVEYEGKTKEEVIEKCTSDLQCKQEDLVLRFEYIEGKLFKPSKCIVYAVRKEEVSDFIKNFIDQFSKMTNIPIVCDVLIQNEAYQVTLVSEQNAILIGKEGKNLNALQLLIRQAIKKELQLNIKINIDASNYKQKRINSLERQIKELAEEVLNSKIDVSLDSMNSYERRLVHSIIGEYKNLKTESIGEGKERHVIIKYVEE